MPPKKKVSSEVEEKANPPAKSSSGGNVYDAPIKYDEYMEGGIPDALLAGLGFAADEADNQQSEEEMLEEEEEEDADPVSTSTKSTSDDLGGKQDERKEHAATLAFADQLQLLSYRTEACAAAGTNTSVVPQPLITSDTVASFVMSQLSALAANQGSRGGLGMMTAKQYVELSSSQKQSSTNANKVSPPQLNRANLDGTGTHRPSPPTSHPSMAMIQSAALDAVRLVGDASVSMAARSSPHLTAPSRQSTDAALRGSRPSVTGSRTITKGNIIYQRMATGEVVASLIKPGEAVRMGGGNRGSVVGRSSSSIAPASDMRVRGDVGGFMTQQSSRGGGGRGGLHQQQQYRQQSRPQGGLNSSHPGPPMESSYCPIDEYCVNEVLERSVKATQSMKLLLGSLRDDLRRIGVTNAVGMVDDQLQLRKQEIAEKLSRAFTAYKQTVEANLELAGTNRVDPTVRRSLPASSSLKPSNPFTNPTIGTGGSTFQMSGQRPPPAHTGSALGGAWQVRGTSAHLSGNRSVRGMRGGRGGLARQAVIPSPDKLTGSDDGATRADGESLVTKTSPGGGRSWRGRGRRRSSAGRAGRDVIELSDSEVEDAIIELYTSPKDRETERRSRDQRAADRAALKRTAPTSGKKAPAAKRAIIDNSEVSKVSSDVPVSAGGNIRDLEQSKTLDKESSQAENNSTSKKSDNGFHSSSEMVATDDLKVDNKEARESHSNGTVDNSEVKMMADNENVSGSGLPERSCVDNEIAT